jgi:hypothetical protein
LNLTIGPREPRTKMTFPWQRRFSLRTVFALMLLLCLVLSVSYYFVFRPRATLRGPSLRLHANGSVTHGLNTGQPLSEEALSGLLDRAIEQFQEASGQPVGATRPDAAKIWDAAVGPSVTLDTHRQ